MNPDLETYLLSHIDAEGDYLYQLYRATNIHTVHGRMASGHLQGRLLKMFVEMIQPKNILEMVPLVATVPFVWQRDWVKTVVFIRSKSTMKWRTLHGHG